MGEDGVRVERGHCHITIPRLDLVLPVDALAQRCRQITAGHRGVLDDGPMSAGETSCVFPFTFLGLQGTPALSN